MDPEAAILAGELVTALRERGTIRSAAVEAAFRAVSRHLFLPNVPLAQVYSDQSFPTKIVDGRAVSSSSQPAVMAMMLEQLDLRQGQRVLEIGAGTGYNSALMAHIVGNSGQVVAIDIDDDIVAAARSHLNAAGYDRVQVERGDGALGYPAAGPYDRIILTVGASDIASAWQAQLAAGGRLVVPLVLRALQKSVAFEPKDGVLSSVSVLSGIFFMPLRGVLGDSEHLVRLGADTSLAMAVDDARRIDVDRVRAALSGVTNEWTTDVYVVAGEIEAGLSTWLELRRPEFCHIFAMGQVADGDLIAKRLAGPDGFSPVSGMCRATTLALLVRPLSGPLDAGGGEPVEHVSPLLVRTVGTDDLLADELVDELRAWDAAGRPMDSNLRIRAFPAERTLRGVVGAPYAELRKGESRLVFDWPDASTPSD